MTVHEPLSQRIVVRYHLSGLTKEELSLCLQHRIELAGTKMNLFEPESLEAMYQATSGLPRKVNLLAHFALNAAALQNDRAVTAEHIMMAAEEMG